LFQQSIDVSLVPSGNYYLKIGNDMQTIHEEKLIKR